MKNLTTILRCQKCLGELRFTSKRAQCVICGEQYERYKGMWFFGIKRDVAKLRRSEMDGEFQWNLVEHGYKDHLRFAQWSFRVAEDAIRVLKQILPFGVILDAGAGNGCHSWQLCRHGYNVIAAEITPELLATGELYCKKEIYFEKLVTDCTFLPLADSCIDAIFCKELAHHLEDLNSLFSEFHRILKPNGILVLIEPMRKVINFRPASDPAREMGLTHQNYGIQDYFLSLARNDFYVFTFKHYRYSINKVYSIFNLIYKLLVHLIKSNKWGNLNILKCFCASLVGGTVALLAKRGENRFLVLGEREIIPISIQRIQKAGNQIAKAKLQQARFLSLLEKVHSESEKELNFGTFYFNNDSQE